MIVLKYICFVIAMIATSLYINNIIADYTRVMTWRENMLFENNKKQEDDSAMYANFRFIVSIIMAITWGVVFIL